MIEISFIPPHSTVTIEIQLPDGYWADVEFYIQRLYDDANWALGRRRRARMQDRSRRALGGLFGTFRDQWRP